MSRKLKHEVIALTKQVERIAFEVDNMMTAIQSLNMRLEALEQRKKPGPKPKSQRNSSQSSKIQFDIKDGIAQPKSATIE